jgi:NCS1 family nucleobase:cation symporter-1
MDVVGLCPQYLNISRGSYLLAILLVVIQPWQIIAKASSFDFVISSFGSKFALYHLRNVYISNLLGILLPLRGVLTTDYFLVRKQALKLADLYTPDPSGIYLFTNGVK